MNLSKIVAYLSCSAGHTHFAWTKIFLSQIIQFAYSGPSEVRATSGANLGRPLFLVNYSSYSHFPPTLAPVLKILEGVVIGFHIFASATKSQKY
jgi:hypothetical protein